MPPKTSAKTGLKIRLPPSLKAATDGPAGTTKQIAQDVPQSAREVLQAKGDVLRFWVTKANEKEKAKPKEERRSGLKRQGRVDDLRARIALYYGFDLEAAQAEASEEAEADAEDSDAEDTTEDSDLSSALNISIRDKQWDFMRELGAEWNEASANNRDDEFHLNSDELPRIHNPLTVSRGVLDITTWHPVPALHSLQQEAASRNMAAFNPVAATLPSTHPIAPQAGDVRATLEDGSVFIITPAMQTGLHIISAILGSQPLSSDSTDVSVGLHSPAGVGYGNAPMATPNALLFPSTNMSSPPSQIPSHIPPASPSTSVFSQLEPDYAAFSEDTAGSASLMELDGEAANPNPALAAHSESPPLPSESFLQQPPIRAPTLAPQASAAAATGRQAPRPGHQRVPSVNATIIQSAMATDALLNIEDADDGLPGVLRLLESGAIRRIREAYGPMEGRKPHPNWKQVKIKVNRHERVGKQVVKYFNNNKDAFLKFFVMTEDSRPAGSRKRKLRSSSEPQYRAYRLVSQAIPHMEADVNRHRKEVQYADPATGEFSEQRWRARWGDVSDNWWMVWRELGLERY
ncbi:hypothetical protein EIP91_011334 [Steccherinum ochraceum]|uniref:Uncharacterized protein n=1 Tax=Steccherinum ochraceum TaxID=92696 RepID=A0A4R0R856_9APHY|nr:hypothetical protein EIP91_011334 [Steccherinum ochraceum]